MNHPGPYIPSTRNRIGARVEWLARLALWEMSQAVQAFERRPLYYQDDKEIRFYGPFEYRSPWQASRGDRRRWASAPASLHNLPRDGIYEIWDRSAYDRLRNAEAREQGEGMQQAQLDGAGVQNAAAGDAYYTVGAYEGDGTLAALGLGNTFQR